MLGKASPACYTHLCFNITYPPIFPTSLLYWLPCIPPLLLSCILSWTKCAFYHLCAVTLLTMASWPFAKQLLAVRSLPKEWCGLPEATWEAWKAHEGQGLSHKGPGQMCFQSTCPGFGACKKMTKLHLFLPHPSLYTILLLPEWKVTCYKICCTMLSCLSCPLYLLYTILSTIDHYILWPGFKVGVGGTLLSPFQSVLVGGEKFCPCLFVSGVPESSLSPLLFNISMKLLGEVIHWLGVSPKM